MINKEVNKSLAIKLLGQRIKESRENKKGKISLSKKETAKKGAKKALSKIKGLRIIPLGGQEEVGRNMTVFEYGEDIVILDMGIQFPEEDMPGVDYIVPDIS